MIPFPSQNYQFPSPIVAILLVKSLSHIQLMRFCYSFTCSCSTLLHCWRGNSDRVLVHVDKTVLSSSRVGLGSPKELCQNNMHVHKWIRCSNHQHSHESFGWLLFVPLYHLYGTWSVHLGLCLEKRWRRSDRLCEWRRIYRRELHI